MGGRREWNGAVQMEGVQMRAEIMAVIGMVFTLVSMWATTTYLLELRRAHNALERYVRQLEQKIEDIKEAKP